MPFHRAYGGFNEKKGKERGEKEEKREERRKRPSLCRPQNHSISVWPMTHSTIIPETPTYLPNLGVCHNLCEGARFGGE